jgi:cerevisin
MLRPSFALLAITLVGAASAKPLSTSPRFDARDQPSLAVAPLVDNHHPHGTLNDSYIVVLKSDLTGVHVQNHLNFLEAAHQSNPLNAIDAGLRHVYDGHIKGYAGKFSTDTVELIRTLPEVAYVEKDQIVHTTDTQRGAPWVR